MTELHPAVLSVQADATNLPFSDGTFDLVIDRGCFHYLSAADRRCYAAETARVTGTGGRLFLRACLSSAGRRNDVDEAGVRDALGGWDIGSIETVDLLSDTRRLPALVVRAVRR